MFSIKSYKSNPGNMAEEDAETLQDQVRVEDTKVTRLLVTTRQHIVFSKEA